MTAAAPILFLADAHLRGPADANQATMERFLAAQPAAPGALVILGDLFDYMAGPNLAAARAYAEVLRSLQRWSPYHYVEGNHDFDLSRRIFPERVAVLHAGPATLQAGGCRLRVFHGDRTSPTDFGTRVLRRLLQSSLVRFARDRLLPDEVAFRLALRFATFSRNRSWPGRHDEYATARLRALKDMHKHGADAVVFAHTHRALLEKAEAGVIANPGAALPGGSYLKLEHRALSLHRFPDGALLPPGPVAISRRRREPG